jgi:hypothetical protein
MSENADDEFLAFLDELRIMAQVGLEYVDDPYDEERYERILELSASGTDDPSICLPKK